MRKSQVRIREFTEGELLFVKKNPSQADMMGRDIAPGTKLLNFDGRATLALATTQPKKAKELIHPLSTRTEDVRLIDAIEVLQWWLSADEVSGSYLGNAYEKAESLLERIYDNIGYDKFMMTLKGRGYNADNLQLIVNDTGSSLSQNYSGEREFKLSKNQVCPDVSWPGVETGPIIDAQGGVSGFYSALGRLEKRMQREEREFSREGWDEVTYIVLKLAPERKDVKFIVVEGKTPITYFGTPVQRPDEVLSQYDFIELDAKNTPNSLRGKRVSEYMKDYWRYHSPMALATNALVDLMDVRSSITATFQRFAGKTPPLVASTQSNLIADQDEDANPDLPFGALYQPKNYDFQEPGAIDTLCQNSHGVVLTPHSENVLKNWDDNVLDLLDMWSTMIVNKQVNVEQFYGKPFIVLNDKKSFSYAAEFNKKMDWDDPAVERAFVEHIKSIDPAKDPWQKFILLTRYLHEKGFVKQEPALLFKQYSPTQDGLGEEIKHLMEKSRDDHIGVPDYNRETFGTDRSDLFEISVLGSAGTRVDEYVDAAKDLGYWSAERAMHVRTGGGNYGIMGAASEGALKFMEKNPDKAMDCHLSAIQMPRTLQFEGACMNPKSIKEAPNKFLSVEKDFDDRMESIFRSNVNVAMAPGIGTYQEIVRWLRNKRDGAPHLQNQKLVLLNSVQPSSPEGARVMDAFLSIVPDSVLKNDLEVVNTLDEVKDIVMREKIAFDARNARQGPQNQSLRQFALN